MSPSRRERQRGLTIMEITAAFSVFFLVIAGSLATRVGPYRELANSAQEGAQMRATAGTLERLRHRPPETTGRIPLDSGETLIVTEVEAGLWQLELRRGSLRLHTYLARQDRP